MVENGENQEIRSTSNVIFFNIDLISQYFSFWLFSKRLLFLLKHKKVNIRDDYI